MKLTKQRSLCAVLGLGTSLAWMVLSGTARAQGFTTTTVQGTVYLANGHPGSGSLQVSWPAFTTANNQAVAAGRVNVTIGADGYVSLNLAANLGAMPAGLYYTAVYHLSDGTTSTEYWVVPAAAQASLSQVRAQVMPAAQAVQAVSKAYVDQSVQELTQSLLTASGGSLSGPLFLNGDPSQPTQAATQTLRGCRIRHGRAHERRGPDGTANERAAGRGVPGGSISRARISGPSCRHA